MSITKTWGIRTLERRLSDGYVKKALWYVDGVVSGEVKTRHVGFVELAEPDTLVPYKDLTEETVIGWVKTKLDADEAGTVTAIESAVENSVGLIVTTEESQGTPW